MATPLEGSKWVGLKNSGRGGSFSFALQHHVMMTHVLLLLALMQSQRHFGLQVDGAHLSTAKAPMCQGRMLASTVLVTAGV